MSTLLAHVTIKAGLEEHWESIAKRVFLSTHENEKGCNRYEYWRGSKDRTYYVLLSFESFDDFMSHQVADYHHNTDFRDCFESITSGIIDDAKDDVWNQYVENHSNETPKWWLEQRAK